jgi:hypothetical protein
MRSTASERPSSFATSSTTPTSRSPTALLTGAFRCPSPGAVYAFRTPASLNDRQKILGTRSKACVLRHGQGGP